MASYKKAIFQKIRISHPDKGVDAVVAKYKLVLKYYVIFLIKIPSSFIIELTMIPRLNMKVYLKIFHRNQHHQGILWLRLRKPFQHIKLSLLNQGVQDALQKAKQKMSTM